MPKKKKKSPSQRALFKKAARELGADKSEANFDVALKQVAQHKPAKDAPDVKNLRGEANKNNRNDQSDR